jgi:mannose-1-phosphate guanylyltransferase/mannose-1-phosphate guanylyltransferase/phosphomannomutase
MKAMVLAAGEGRRMRPLTESLPKPMLPVARRPLLAHIVDLLSRHGVTDVGVNLHHQPETIVAYLERMRQAGLQVTFSMEERLLGSAGGVKRLEAFFEDGPFFVIYGDVLTDIDLTALAAFHIQRRAAVSIALYEAEDLTACGVARLGAGDRIVEFVEKPAPAEAPSTWANAGVYVVEPDVLRNVPPNRHFDFGQDLFPLLLAEGAPLFGYRSDAVVIDIGTLEGYRKAQAAAALMVAQQAA